MGKRRHRRFCFNIMLFFLSFGYYIVVIAGLKGLFLWVKEPIGMKFRAIKVIGHPVGYNMTIHTSCRKFVE